MSDQWGWHPKTVRFMRGFGLTAFVPFLLGAAAFFAVGQLMETMRLDYVLAQMTADVAKNQKILADSVHVIPTKAEHIEARYGVGAAFFLFIAAGALAFVHSAREICLSIRPRFLLKTKTATLPARGALFAGALAGSMAIALVVESSGPRFSETLVGPVFKYSLGECSVCGCRQAVIENGQLKHVWPTCPQNDKVTGSEDGKTARGQTAHGVREPLTYLEFADGKVAVANVVSVFVSVFVTFAVCGLVLQARNYRRRPNHNGNDLFAELARRWKVQLYFASAFLIAGVLEMSAWRHWPAAYIDPKSALLPVFEAAANGTVMFQGLMFTVVLFGIFFSGAMLIDREYVKAGLDKGQTSGDDLIDFRQLLSIKELLKSSSAMLAPFLGGAAPALIEIFGKLGGGS